MKIIDTIAAVLVVIGGLNWGLVGLIDFNVVDFLFGQLVVDRVIYVLVGLSALHQAINHKTIRARWCNKKSE